jgi:hypothetical protein
MVGDVVEVWCAAGGEVIERYVDAMVACVFLLPTCSMLWMFALMLTQNKSRTVDHNRSFLCGRPLYNSSMSTLPSSVIRYARSFSDALFPVVVSIPDCQRLAFTMSLQQLSQSPPCPIR